MKLSPNNLFADKRRWSGFRYQIYQYMDFRSNRHHFNLKWVISLLFNLLYFLIPLSALTPMIMNYVILDGYDAWTKVAKIGSQEYLCLVKFVREIGIYFFYEYFFLYFFLVDFILRWIIADYQSPNKNWKAFLKYPFNPLNFYEIAVFTTFIALYHSEGHFINGYYIINIGIFNTDVLPHSTTIQQLAQTWLRAQIVYVALFLGLIFTVFNRVGSQGKRTTLNFRSFLLKKLKIPLIATIFLVVLILIFSFVILKAEQSYYASIHQTPPSSSPQTFWQSVWYCFITISTVGYGQFIPQSPAGRSVAIVLILIGTSYYAFYGVFIVSVYTTFIQKKQIDRDQKLQMEIEERKQNELVNKIKKSLISDLIQYKVIDKTIYENFQNELKQRALALQQDKIDEANHSAFLCQVTEKRWLITPKFLPKKHFFSTTELAIVANAGKLYSEKTFSGKYSKAVVFPMNKKTINKLYTTEQNVILSNYYVPNAEQILVYVTEPYNYCFGSVWVTNCQRMSATEIWNNPDFTLIVDLKSESDIQKTFGNNLFVYQITKKIIYSKHETITGVSSLFSRHKFFKLVSKRKYHPQQKIKANDQDKTILEH